MAYTPVFTVFKVGLHCKLKQNKKSQHQPGKTIHNPRRDGMFCLDVLEYFIHDLLFRFHNETQVGAIKGLGKPVIILQDVSITFSWFHNLMTSLLF